MTKEQLDAIRARVETAPKVGDTFVDENGDEMRIVETFEDKDFVALLAEVERLTAERDAAKLNSRGLQKELREAKARHKEALDLCERYMGHLHKAEAERDAAFRRGVAAMRKEAADLAWLIHGQRKLAQHIRALPDPEDRTSTEGKP